MPDAVKSIHHPIVRRDTVMNACGKATDFVMCSCVGVSSACPQRVVRSSHRNWREAEAEAFEDREKVDARYLQLQNVLFEKARESCVTLALFG